MNGAVSKANRRDIRKALGPEAFDVLQEHTIRIRAHAQILRRGFWGRLKWLFLGR